MSKNVRKLLNMHNYKYFMSIKVHIVIYLQTKNAKMI